MKPRKFNPKQKNEQKTEKSEPLTQIMNNKFIPKVRTYLKRWEENNKSGGHRWLVRGERKKEERWREYDDGEEEKYRLEKEWGRMNKGVNPKVK